MSDGRGPNLFIVGAPRCGTTSLFRHIGGHPDVFAASEKEPHFFDTDVFRPARRLTESEYLGLFDGVDGERWRVEATATYLYSARARQEIARCAPEARVVIMLRNPVDLIESWHGLLTASGAESVHGLAAAIELEQARRSGELLPHGAEAWPYMYVEKGCVAADVEHWLRLFGPERVHVVILEDLVERPTQELVALGRFLELDLLPLGTLPHANARRAPAPSLLARETGARSLLRRLLPAAVRRRLWRLVARVGARRSAPERAVDRELRAALTALVRPDTERLAKLLGRDLDRLWFSDATPSTLRHGRRRASRSPSRSAVAR